MSVTFGFYNSVNHDRTYDAKDMSSLFDGIINDGVFQSIGDALIVEAGSGMNVNVGTGRAWFDHTWTHNDAVLPLSINEAELTLTRIDAVVLEVDETDSVRENSIKIVTGPVGVTPSKPALTNTETVHQHALAYVTITAGTTSITSSMIENVVGTSETPFITGILETINADVLLAQWDGQFDEWFEHLRDELDSNQAANLQNQIDTITNTMNALIRSEETHTFSVPSTSWVANDDTSTSGLPWIAEVETDIFSDISKPNWEMVSAINYSGIPASTEMESINSIRFAIFSATGVKLYAAAKPTVNLKLYTKGV